MDDRTLRRHVLEELDFDPKSIRRIGRGGPGRIVTLLVMSAPMPRRSRRADSPSGQRGQAVVEEIAVAPVPREDGRRGTRRTVVKTWPGTSRCRTDDPGEVSRMAATPRWLLPLLSEGGRPGRRREARGVREVLNLLAVTPPVRSADVKAKVLAALKRTARDPAITVAGGRRHSDPGRMRRFCASARVPRRGLVGTGGRARSRRPPAADWWVTASGQPARPRGRGRLARPSRGYGRRRMAFDDQTFWGARGRSGRPLPRWLRARLSRRRRATVDGQGHGAPRAPGKAEPAEPQPDAPTERPMTVEALLRVVQVGGR